MVLSLVLPGCEKATEKIIESSSGGKVKVDASGGKITVKTEHGTTQAGGANEWPGKIPADVPRFTYGKITSISETNTKTGATSIFVGIGEVKPADLDKYENSLTNAGWKMTSTSKSESGLLLTATKDKKNIIASFSGNRDKGFSGGISYTEKK